MLTVACNIVHAEISAETGPMKSKLSQNDQRRYSYFYTESLRQQMAGNFAAAFDLMRHAQWINPLAPEVYYHLAGYFIDLKNDSLAGRNFEKAARLNPKNTTYTERLAQYYINAGEYKKSVDTYERLCNATGDRLDLLQVMLQLYATDDDYDKMINILNRMEILEGGSTEQIALSRMQIYEKQGKKGKELEELQSLVAKHPNDLNFKVMMGNWLLQNNKSEEALKVYKSVLKEEPDNAAAQMSMLDYYKANGQNQKADDLLMQLLTSKKTASDTKMTLLRQAIQDSQQVGGDSMQVFRLFDKVLSQPQNNADFIMLKAAYMSVLHMPDSLIDATYEQAVSVEPDNSRARLLLLQDIWEKKQYDKVIAISRPAQEYNPDEMAFYYFEGLAHFQKGEKEEALTTFRKGVGQIKRDSNPDIVSDFYVIMGDILHEKGLYKEAFAAYDSCLQWKPDNIGCLNNYAYYLSVLGRDLGKAEQMSYKTIKAEPTNSTYLDTYAWILFQQERYSEARIYIEQAIKNDSTLSNVVTEHAGDIYYMAGEKEKAVEYWQRAQREGNESATLRKKIALKRYIAE